MGIHQFQVIRNLLCDILAEQKITNTLLSRVIDRLENIDANLDGISRDVDSLERANGATT